MAKKFHTIITHIRPHIDEIFAMWLLRKFGEFLFPGISTADIEYRSTSPGLLDGKTAKKWEEEGVLLAGIGKGRFDEHSGVGATEKKENCCTTLVAKALGVYSNPALEDLITFVFNDDTDTDPKKRHPFDLGRLVMARNKNNSLDSERVTEMTFVDINSFYFISAELLSLDKESINASEVMIEGPKGKAVKLVLIDKCDSEQIGKFSRSAAGYESDITVVRKTTGHINISVNMRSGIRLFDVSIMLNCLERKASCDRRNIDWKKLAEEGAVKDGRWYHHKGLNMLFNGGTTASNVKPTQLLLKRIGFAITIAINPNRFEPSKAEECKEGVCAGKTCSYYNYGFSRCKTIRYNTHQEKELEKV